MLTFDPQTGLVAPSTTEIREQIETEFIKAFRKDGSPKLNTEPETPAGQLIDSITAIIADKNAEILYLANQFNPMTAEGQWQAALGRIYFIEPYVASNAVATCTCTGLVGTVIQEGSLIESELDRTQWKCLSTTVIPNTGTVDIEFQCLTGGKISATANTLTKIITVTAGWDTVTNTEASTTGQEAETQIAFEKRRYNCVAANSRGSVNSLYGTIAQIDGVVDVMVLENFYASSETKFGVTIPAHSVWITVVGGEGSDIAEAIYKNKDAGCGTSGNTEVSYTDSEITGNPTYTYKICRPTSLPFAFKVQLHMNSSTPNNIADLVKTAIVNEFNGSNTNPRVGTAQHVYAARFYDCVYTAGATDLIGITMKAPTTSSSWVTTITVNADKEPVLDPANITVDIVN